MKVLFLLKKNNNYGMYPDPSTGLFNSASILANQLEDKLHIKTTVAICVDGNSIDRQLHIHRPNVCIIEAIWASAARLAELRRLHPRIKFLIRVHSELPFLSNEGSALENIGEYEKLGFIVGVNSKDTYAELKGIYNNIVYMPNVYEDVNISVEDFIKYLTNLLQYIVDPSGWTKLSRKSLNIGCFGAIRPMKNQLLQAVSAINYADKAGVKLYFHMNGSRVEQKGDSVLKNLISLFERSKHELVLHRWMPRSEFLELISHMDLGMQVSMNESFNIVAADFVKMGVPIVVSEAIKWAPEFSQTSTIRGKEVQEKIGQALRYKRMFKRGQTLHLDMYNQQSLKIWREIFHGH